MQPNCFIEIIITKIIPPYSEYNKIQLEFTGDNPDIIVKNYLLNEGIDDLEKCLIHSTSWRYEDPQNIILTYLIVIPENFVYTLHEKIDVTKEHLAVSENSFTPRPTSITTNNVIKHAFRHLAYLLKHDYENQYLPLFTEQQVAYVRKNYDEVFEKIEA